jgi:hypothetical protein
MSIPNVSNDRIPDHIPPPDQYLAITDTLSNGDYHMNSMDPDNIGSITGKITGDNNFSFDMFDKNGHYAKAIYGGHKQASDSHTQTVTNHSDTGIGGGYRENITQGKFSSTGAGAYRAHNGSTITASAENHMSLSAGGDGHHAMKGDQSFIVKEGGIHNKVDKDYTITSLGSIHQNATNEYSVFVTGNEGHSAGANISMTSSQNIILTATTSIQLIVGSSSIVITGSGITITAPAVDFNKS